MAVTVRDSNTLHVGEPIVAIGNADGDGISATVGRLSVDSEYITMLGVDEVTTVTFRSLRIDAAVNPGNSGGGVFDANGYLIGIVNSKTVKSGVEGMANAIPSTIAINVAENIIWNASGGRTGVSKGLMGVQVTASESKAVYDEQTGLTTIVETVMVDVVNAGALVSGVLQNGDILVSIEHEGVVTYCTRMFIVVDYMLKVRPGDQITVNFIRNGVEMKHTFTIESKHFTNIA
jgi:serine protease Do